MLIGSLGLFGFQRERLLKALAGANGDHLAVIDLQIRPLEAQLVFATGDAVIGERRVLGGVLAVDPNLGPGARADGDAAVAAFRGLGLGAVAGVVLGVGAGVGADLL